MLAQPAIQESDFYAWQNDTREYLAQSFGENHRNVPVVAAAGQIIDFGGRDRDPLFKNALRDQIALLKGCIEQLREKLIDWRSPTHDQPPAPSAAEREYDVAQICLNGHVVNAHTKRLPVHSAAYCGPCGAATTTTCARCQKPIRGHYWGPDAKGGYEKPAHCLECGWPYPWTSTALATAREMAAELEGLNSLVKDSPRTTLAATRFKKLLAKAGPEAAAAFKQILINVVTQAAKGQIWPT